MFVNIKMKNDDPRMSNYDLWEDSLIKELLKWVKDDSIIQDILYPNNYTKINWLDNLLDRDCNPEYVSMVLERGYSLFLNYNSRIKENLNSFNKKSYLKYIEDSDKSSKSLTLLYKPFRN